MPMTALFSDGQTADATKKRPDHEHQTVSQLTGEPPRWASCQRLGKSSHGGAKELPCAEESEAFLTSRTTTQGDVTSVLSPITKSVLTADADDEATIASNAKPLLGDSVVVLPTEPKTAGISTSNSSSAASMPAAATKPSARPALGSVRVPDGVDCCPIPRWNWVQSENGNRRGTSVSSAQASVRSRGQKIDAGIFGVTEANRDAMENLSPFKQWEFTRFLAAQPDTSTTSSSCRTCTKPTLVLDLDETLVHTSTEPMPDSDAHVTVHVPAKQSPGGKSSSYVMFIKYRPGLRRFLHYCLAHFDVVVFTASRHYYAAAIVEQLEMAMPEIRFVGPERRGTTPTIPTITLLSRDHCTPTNAGYVKDLFLLGCDLRRTVLIDNNIVCGAFQPYNFIHIKDFARRAHADGGKTAESMKHDAEKGMVLPSNSTAAAITASTPSQEGTSGSTLVWMDSDDTVLDELIAPGGVLEYLTKCDDIPAGLRHVLAESLSK